MINFKWFKHSQSKIEPWKWVPNNTNDDCYKTLNGNDNIWQYIIIKSAHGLVVIEEIKMGTLGECNSAIVMPLQKLNGIPYRCTLTKRKNSHDNNAMKGNAGKDFIWSGSNIIVHFFCKLSSLFDWMLQFRIMYMIFRKWKHPKIHFHLICHFN